MTNSISLNQVNWGTLRAGLMAMLLGMAFMSVIELVPLVLVVAITSLVILAFGHTSNWIPYAIGVVVGILLVAIFPQLKWTAEYMTWGVLIIGAWII